MADEPVRWRLPCSSQGCDADAAETLFLRGQPGHVHDCHPHAAALREFCDVISSSLIVDGKCPAAACTAEPIYAAAPAPLPEVWERNTVALQVSRDLAIALVLVEPTPEEVERLRREREAYEADRAVKEAQPGPDVTLDALLDLLGWPAAFAAHLMHPACCCMIGSGDDPYLCDWARRLGFVLSFREVGVLGWGVEGPA